MEKTTVICLCQRLIFLYYMYGCVDSPIVNFVFLSRMRKEENKRGSEVGRDTKA